jgi:TM2 domain-containing membrane protein YozV
MSQTPDPQEPRPPDSADGGPQAAPGQNPKDPLGPPYPQTDHFQAEHSQADYPSTGASSANSTQGYQQAPESYPPPGGQADSPAGYPPPGFPQQGNPQAYQQQGYPQPAYQQQFPQQGYPQPGYGPGGYGGPEQKSKIAAGLLGIFLGTFGIHNFYLGYNGKAIAQLLISVLSLGILAWASAIWGLIEGILILTGSENFRTDARGIPLRD